MTEPIFKRMQALETEVERLKIENAKLKNQLFTMQHKTTSTGYTTNPVRRIVSRHNSNMIAEWSSQGLNWSSSNNNFSGKAGPATTRGRLESDKYWELAQQADYVIYSYDTPIAWISNGGVKMTDERYGTTTTNKQNMVKASFLTLSESE